jgi:hypothetical protein
MYSDTILSGRFSLPEIFIPAKIVSIHAGVLSECEREISASRY